MPSEARCGRNRATVSAAAVLRSPYSNQLGGVGPAPPTNYCRKNLRLGMRGSAGMALALFAVAVTTFEEVDELFNWDPPVNNKGGSQLH